MPRRRTFVHHAVLAIAGVLAGETALARSPQLDWAARIGANAADSALAAATGADGDVYLAGAFGLTVDFDPGPGVHEVTADVHDPFLARYDAGGALVWAAAFVGSNFPDQATAVAASGDAVFVCGEHQSTIDADPGAGTLLLASPSQQNPNFFCGRYTASAGELVWAFTIGDTGAEQVRRVALDSAGDLVVAGLFQGTVDFDPGPGLVQLSAALGSDVFFAKYTADGDLVWARSLVQSTGGGLDDVGGLVVDPSDDSIYLVGTLDGTIDFDPGPGVHAISSGGGADPFIARYDAAGGLLWAHALDSASNVNHGLGAGLAGDELWVTGTITGETDFDPDPLETALRSGPGGFDLFLARYTAGGGFLWAEAFGGTGTDRPEDLRVGPSGEITITGSYDGEPDVDPGPGIHLLPPTLSTRNGFVARYRAADGELRAAGAFEATTAVAGNGVLPRRLALGPAAGEVVVGSFPEEVDFDPGPGEVLLESAGFTDAFFVRLEEGTLIFADGFESGDAAAWSQVAP